MAHLDLDPVRHSGALDPGGAVRLWPPEADREEGLLLGGFRVEARPLESCRAIEAQWRALAAEAVEPNVFAEPDFLLTAAQHLPEAAQQVALLVWEAGASGRLLAFWALQRPRAARAPALAKGFASRYASSGTPLLASGLAVEAACALIEGAMRIWPDMAGAMFREVPLDGAGARALRAAAVLSGMATAELDVHARACLWPGAPGQLPAARRLRDLARLNKGLAAHGDVRLVTARQPADVRAAVEAFLALEASGWKARRGTSILSSARDAAFFRILTRSLALRGQMEVHLLEAGGRVAAAGLVLSAGRHAWFLKMAYDEEMAQHAPGASLTFEVGLSALATRARDPDAAGAGGFIDSCAVPGHRLMERMWKGRARVGDLAIGPGGTVEIALAREAGRRRTRAIAKRFYYALRGWSV
jgi:CelD/BcsL family acetyltransferase involved in cellulose biosynthesis